MGTIKPSRDVVSFWPPSGFLKEGPCPYVADGGIFTQIYCSFPQVSTLVMIPYFTKSNYKIHLFYVPV